MAVADRAPGAAPDALEPRTYSYTDTTTHHSYRLVVTPGPTRGVPARFEAFVDGQKVTQTDFQWAREPGGWRVQSAHFTGYYRGAILAQGDVTATTGEVSAASWNLMGALAVLGKAVRPTELQAMQICALEWAIYTLAYGSYMVAAAELFLNPNPLTIANYWLAAGTVAVAEAVLIACYENGGNPA